MPQKISRSKAKVLVKSIKCFLLLKLPFINFVNNIEVALGRCQKRKTKRHLSCKALRRYFRVGTRRMTFPTPFSLRRYFREGTRRVTLPTPLPCDGIPMSSSLILMMMVAEA